MDRVAMTRWVGNGEQKWKKIGKCSITVRVKRRADQDLVRVGDWHVMCRHSMSRGVEKSGRAGTVKQAVRDGMRALRKMNP